MFSFGRRQAIGVAYHLVVLVEDYGPMCAEPHMGFGIAKDDSTEGLRASH